MSLKSPNIKIETIELRLVSYGWTAKLPKFLPLRERLNGEALLKFLIRTLLWEKVNVLESPILQDRRKTEKNC